MDNDKIKSRDRDIIISSSLLTAVVTLCLFISETVLKKGALFEADSVWIIFSAISLGCCVTCAFLVLKESSTRSWLYILCLLYLLLVFCCVNASGGLTKSPFISFYATILAVGIIISISGESADPLFSKIKKGSWLSKTPRSLAFLVISIVLCMLAHLLLQHGNLVGQPMQNVNLVGQPMQNVNLQMPFVYLLKYMTVILIALIATGVADYKSLNSVSSQTDISESS